MSDEMWANEFSSFVDKQLECANVRVKFPHAILCAPRDGLVPSPCSSRIDLRDTPCFTIDCSSTKDMDDAVSVEKTAIGYALGVHIADVAAYVKPGSSFDTCAMERGTSHYLPDRTIPMLPPVLSADLCSLNPCEDRLAVSVLVTLDANGAVVGYEVVKSTIRSRVKGVYDEVNAILEGVATPEVSSKYAAVIDQLPIMGEVNSCDHRPLPVLHCLSQFGEQPARTTSRLDHLTTGYNPNHGSPACRGRQTCRSTQPSTIDHICQAPRCAWPELASRCATGAHPHRSR